MDASLLDVVNTMRRNTHRMSGEELLDMVKVASTHTRQGYDYCLLLWCASQLKGVLEELCFQA